jgi:hypothetical protein
MVDDHDQVALALLVADLIDADAMQPGQQVDLAGPLDGDPGAHPTDRAPGQAQQLGDSGAGGVDRQPRHGVLKPSGEPGAMTRPRHRSDQHAVGGAGDAGRVGLQQRRDRAKVERAPATSPLALVVAGTATTAQRAAASAAAGRPHHGDKRTSLLVEHDLLDHRVLDTKQPLPYPCGSHAVSTSCGTSLGQPEP